MHTSTKEDTNLLPFTRMNRSGCDIADSAIFHWQSPHHAATHRGNFATKALAGLAARGSVRFDLTQSAFEVQRTGR
jgi:hypothetical protein